MQPSSIPCGKQGRCTNAILSSHAHTLRLCLAYPCSKLWTALQADTEGSNDGFIDVKDGEWHMVTLTTHHSTQPTVNLHIDGDLTAQMPLNSMPQAITMRIVPGHMACKIFFLKIRLGGIVQHIHPETIYQYSHTRQRSSKRGRRHPGDWSRHISML